MLQTYKKAEEYIARSKTGSFKLLPYTAVTKKTSGGIEFGGLTIHPDDTITINSNLYLENESLAYVGVNVIPFTQKLKQTMIGVLPTNREPRFMTVHAGKVYPITEKSIFKYGVLQNPEPLMTITKEAYKKVSSEVRTELDTTCSMAMLISEDELRKNSQESDTYVVGYRVRIAGRSLTDVKKEMRAEMMQSRILKLPFTETINYEV